MGLDKRFRVAELVQSGSKAIISENEEGEHTFVVPSPEGDRDGETYGYVEKPSYNNQELRRALDTAVDELFVPPENELPEVVPLATFNRLQNEFATASLEIVSSSIQIDELLSENSRLEAASASLSILYSQSQFDLMESIELTQTQSLEITAKTEKIQRLQIYTASLESDLERIETEFEIASNNVEQAVSTVSELREKTAGLESEVRSVIAGVQNQSIISLGREIQGDVADVRGRVQETRGDVQETEGRLEQVLGRLQQIGGVLGDLISRVFNR